MTLFGDSLRRKPSLKEGQVANDHELPITRFASTFENTGCHPFSDWQKENEQKLMTAAGLEPAIA